MSSNIFYIHKNDKKSIHSLMDDLNQIRNLRKGFSNFSSIKMQNINLTLFVTYSYEKYYHKVDLNINPYDRLGHLSLNEIIENLNLYKHIIIKNHIVSYRVDKKEESSELNLLNDTQNENAFNPFVFLGNFPFNKQYIIDIPFNRIIYINLRPILHKGNEIIYEVKKEEEIPECTNEKFLYIGKNKDKNISKRAKERHIGYVIKKVYIWKKLSCSAIDKNGKKAKMTLNDAAECIGISKKSLDEYINQIRLGSYFGFDFNRHKYERVGILRAFVKGQIGDQKNIDNMKSLLEKMEQKEEINSGKKNDNKTINNNIFTETIKK